MKKIFVILLLLTICFTFFYYSFTMNFNSISDEEKNISSIIDTPKEVAFYNQALPQQDAIIFYDKLITAFINKYGEDKGQPSCYPENYAGAYINDEGKLVIQITDINNYKTLNSDGFYGYSNYVDLKKIKEEYVEFKAENISDIVIFEKAKYSLNELNSMLVVVVNRINENLSVSGYYVDTLNNTVNIMLESSIYEKVADSIDKFNKMSSDGNEKIPLVLEIKEITEPDAKE